MASMESKILDGKAAGYCSSSDEEDSGFRVVNDDDDHQARAMRQMGVSEQTGVKAVLRDHEDFIKEQQRQRMRDLQQAAQTANKGMLSGKRKESAEDSEDLDDEELMAALRAQRVAELRKAAAGKIIELNNQEELLHGMEKTAGGLLVVLLYEPRCELSGRVSVLLRQLAGQYGAARFARITATAAGMSSRFVADGVPALQVYESGELVCNAVQLATLIGQDPTLFSLLVLFKKHRVSLSRNRLLLDDESEDDEE